jgi:hypothetical protein
MTAIRVGFGMLCDDIANLDTHAVSAPIAKLTGASYSALGMYVFDDNSGQRFLA